MNFRAIYVQEVPKLTELTNEKKSRETKTRGARHKQRRIRVSIELKRIIDLK